MKIGYARVSTRDQSLELQVEALKEFGCEKIYQEVASGSKTARIVLDELMNNIRAGDILVIWKLDRLGRNLVHLLNIIDELGKKDIGFVSLNDPIDTTTGIGTFMFHLIASMAEFERAIIIERVNAGLRSARARGRLGGKPKGLSEIAKEKAKVAKILYTSKNVSISSIIKQLGISKPTLYSYLRYMGVEIGPSPIKKVINI